MALVARLTLLALCACAHAQYAEDRAPRYIASEPKVASTPVPILKQINRHNEDGSYTYGYEAADGSFKIETKGQNGEVKGKYGYKDDTGKLRVIEYGANKYGFQPAGEGITVAPPTLVDETTREEGLRPSKSQQGGRSNYRGSTQAQSIDYDYEEPAPRPAPRPAPTYRPQPQPQQQYRPPPQPQPQQQYRPPPQPQPQPQQQYRPPPQPQPQPQQQYRPPPQPQPQQQYRPQPQSAPTPPKPQFFAGAAPVPAEDNSFFSPEPQTRQQYRSKQEFRPAPQAQHFASRPQELNSQFDQAPARFSPSGQQQRSQSYSMLDQLLKEYSLPQGGSAPTHDITFGSY